MSFEFFWNVEIATPGDVFFGELSPWSVWNIAFDNGADSGCGLIRKGVNSQEASGSR